MAREDDAVLGLIDSFKAAGLGCPSMDVLKACLMVGARQLIKMQATYGSTVVEDLETGDSIRITLTVEMSND